MQSPKIRPGVSSLNSEEATQLAVEAYAAAEVNLLARVLTDIASESRRGLFYIRCWLPNDADTRYADYVCGELAKRGFGAKFSEGVFAWAPYIDIWWN